jgi:alanine racemase
VVRTLAGKVEMFGVANVAEAAAISEHAGATPVCLLGATLPAEQREVVARGFIPMISCYEEAAQYAALAGSRTVRVHLVVDTGMGRLGVWEDDAFDAARRIVALPGIEVAGIASHLPCADSDPDFTSAQLRRFLQLAARIRDTFAQGAILHVENSAGLLTFPDLAGGMVRPGLALYGESPLPEFQPQLTPALSWKTRVLLVREFGPGRGVSYGRTFITPRTMRIATLAVGYADGFPRQLSGRGVSVLIGGRRCALLGRVTMDQILVDVSTADAAPGDEAVLIGTQGAERITATELATNAGTIPWDILTGIGPRVTRLYPATG